MPDPEKHQIIEFGRLNLLGKAIFVVGATVRTTAHLIDKTLDKAVDLVLEAERAFKEGRDGTVEDAKVIGEWEKESGRSQVNEQG